MLSCCFISGSFSVNPRFITSNDGGDEVGVVSSLFLKLRADANAVFLLVIDQVLGTNIAAVRHMLSSPNKIC
jgi:hypothetical protein